ncbi:MAG TPA: ABC transporter permease [Thermoanaerobaculia bacterium]|nr:ABC transporter permease [Thermoanaerobaculia bacterium]
MSLLGAAARAVARRSRSSALTVAVLALGIGLVAAMASVLRGVWLRGLPFPDGDRIVAFSTGSSAAYAMRPDDWRAIRDAQRALSEVAAFRTFNAVVTEPSRSRLQRSVGTTVTYVTANLFPMLGVQPIVGRGFAVADEDPGAAPVALLSYSLWQREYAGAPDVVGRVVEINGEPTIVVGVMPKGFHFPVRQEIWGILRFAGRPWSASGLFAVGKLGAGASPRQAAAELGALVARLDLESPLGEARQHRLEPYVDAVLHSGMQRALRLMAVAVAGVLLAACLNVAGLRLVDAAARESELAVRSALGASRARLTALLFGEALCLAGAGVLGGLGVAWALVELAARRLVAGGPLRSSFWIDVRLDPQVLGIAALAGGAAAVLGGLTPALWSSARAALRLRARSSDPLPSSAMVRIVLAGQIAAGFVLLLFTGLMASTALALSRPALGFDPAGLASAIVYQPQLDTPDARRAFNQRLLASLEARPEIETATLASFWPWGRSSAAGGGPRRTPIVVEGSSGPPRAEPPAVPHLQVMPGFFAAMRLALLEGRAFDGADLHAARSLEDVGGESGDRAASPRPVVVSRSFARRHLDGAAVGKVIQLGAPESRRVEIVGVVADLGIERGSDPSAAAMIYEPYLVASRSGGFLVVRGRGAASSVTRAIDRAIADADPRAAAIDHQTFDQAMAESTWIERRLAQVLSLFAIATLLVAACGLYAVLASTVERRAREFGIRLAVGATPGDVRALVLRACGGHLLLGVATGAALAALLSRFLQPFLYRVEIWDPTISAMAIAAVALTAAVASLRPAHGAARTDPAITLRAE